MTVLAYISKRPRIGGVCFESSVYFNSPRQSQVRQLKQKLCLNSLHVMLVWRIDTAHAKTRSKHIKYTYAAEGRYTAVNDTKYVCGLIITGIYDK